MCVPVCDSTWDLFACAVLVLDIYRVQRTTYISFISYFFLDLRAVSSGSPISLSLHLRNKFESALRTLFVPGRYIVFETVSELILSKELEINYLKLGPTKSGFPNLGNTFSGQRSYTMEMRLFALKHVDSISPGV